MTNWADNAKLVEGLWQEYAPTQQERDLLAERFGRLNQAWLADAIKSHRTEDASGRYKPSFPAILARYKAIAESGDVVERAASGEPKPIGWRVGRTVEYAPYGPAGPKLATQVVHRDDFRTLDAAERSADQLLGGFVLPMEIS